MTHFYKGENAPRWWSRRGAPFNVSEVISDRSADALSALSLFYVCVAYVCMWVCVCATAAGAFARLFCARLECWYILVFVLGPTSICVVEKSVFSE